LFHLVLESPSWKGLGADSEEKHEPASDIDAAVVVDSLKALDPNRPIREADNICSHRDLAGFDPAVWSGRA
jgi:hypothetical protein